jgi:hypothetical protein
MRTGGEDRDRREAAGGILRKTIEKERYSLRFTPLSPMRCSAAYILLFLCQALASSDNESDDSVSVVLKLNQVNFESTVFRSGKFFLICQRSAAGN